MLEKRMKILLRERSIVESLILLPEQAKKLILKQYDNEIKLIINGTKEDSEIEVGEA